MTQQHPTTPPPELVQQWIEEGPPLSQPKHVAHFIADRAAQWGADQELEACCEWIPKATPWDAEQLRAARRPKPPSLKEKLTEALYNENIGEALRLVEQLDD
ncbi:hypothetical protein S-CBS2_gp065 [Synechococcus phage S-CBS2]|uniref:hypothetical protein n=1 Tax=Synechococcus phage S-CBS2 TaxID=753084 RepID=UPI000207841A|nr:hypothetical protein S-CBS2_gp065 [Synechococcus phage S-CBS2]ADF42421.1 hypothetical protein S-CBS2_gp065 [Synechococcus phage S-CBS2]